VSSDDHAQPAAGGRPEPKPVLQFRPRRRRPRKDDDGPAALADLLVPTLAKMGLRTRARQMQLVNHWPTVVGDMVAEHTSVAGFYRGRLTIETDSPAMGHALLVQRHDIMERLNAAIGLPIVADIRFRLAGEQP
jgi:predicted nucleic acid-binding Zn ribbon protein